LLFICIGDSQRYSKRANDKGHRRRLKGGERILKSYQLNASNVLQVIDEEHLVFRIQSETTLGTWYTVSLNTHFCNCPDRNSTCKHILGVQLIVEKYFQAPKENEIVEDMMVMEDNTLDVPSIFPTNMDAVVGESSVCNEDCAKLLLGYEELQNLARSGRASIGDYNADEIRHKLQLLQSFLKSFSRPFTSQRPATINLPRNGANVSIIQEHVTRTRMGHKRKRVASEIGEESASQPPLKRPSRVLISHSKQKRAIFRKLLKVNCENCATLVFVKGGATSISCKNCDHEMSMQ